MLKKIKNLIRLWLIVLICLPLYHCGSSSSDSDAVILSRPPADTPSSIDDVDFPAAGDYDKTLIHDGELRSFRVHIPESYTSGHPVPLVIDIHCLLGWPIEQAKKSGWIEKSEEIGFIVVHPTGTPQWPRSWNGQGCCADNQMDDVGFMKAIVTDISKTIDIDPDRVYATGMSNGASLAHRLACEAADVFSAIAPTAFQFNAEPGTCLPDEPVGVIAFHGTQDTVVPYDGSGFGMSLSESNATWAEINSCTDGPETTSIGNNGSFCETYSNCADGVKVTACTIIGGNHNLYGNNAQISIADLAWAHFVSY